LKGIKPCARQEINEKNLDRALSFFDSYSIHYSLADFKFVEGGAMVERDSQVPGKYFVYFSMDKDLVQKAKFYEAVRNDEKLGEVLGYPQCCTKFYLDNYEEAAKIGDEYSLLTIANSNGFPFQTNYLMRYFGVSLLSHFPCAFTCKDSYELAMKMYTAVYEENPELADYIKNTLRGPVITNVGTGIHVLKDYELHPDGVVGYRDPWLTNQNELYDVLRMCNNIRIVNKNHVQFRQDTHVVDEIKGKEIGAVVFE